MYSVLIILSEYTYFYISKKLLHTLLCLVLKSSKALSVSLSPDLILHALILLLGEGVGVGAVQNPADISISPALRGVLEKKCVHKIWAKYQSRRKSSSFTNIFQGFCLAY